MADIFTLMEELGYPTERGGVCHGLGLMAERARRVGKYPKFKERMGFLARLRKGKLANGQNRQ